MGRDKDSNRLPAPARKIMQREAAVSAPTYVRRLAVSGGELIRQGQRDVGKLFAAAPAIAAPILAAL
jgi:hypothetical protein